MTLIDKAEAHDDDLIRRGDVLAILNEYVGWGDHTIADIAALPARGVGAPTEATAIRHSFDGYGWQYIDAGSGSDWVDRGMAHPDAEPLYARITGSGEIARLAREIGEIGRDLGWHRVWERADAILAALGPTDAAQAREASLKEAVARLRAAPVSGDTAIALGNAHAIAVLEAMIGETPPDPQQAREAALAVLAGLSSYLGTGLGDDDTTAEQFDKRIRWAIDDLTARTRQAALREAAALCDGEERSGGTGWECRDAILALIGEPRT